MTGTGPSGTILVGLIYVDGILKFMLTIYNINLHERETSSNEF